MEYTNKIENITAAMLESAHGGGFFAGWPNPPSSNVHLEILRRSYTAWVAIDTTQASAQVVGFVNAVSDGILTAYIPLLEVRPQYQGRGIGKELMRRILDELSNLYMIDIVHDKELAAFYAKFGAFQSHASIFRNYAAQSGAVTQDK